VTTAPSKHDLVHLYKTYIKMVGGNDMYSTHNLFKIAIQPDFVKKYFQFLNSSVLGNYLFFYLLPERFFFKILLSQKIHRFLFAKF